MKLLSLFPLLVLLNLFDLTSSSTATTTTTTTREWTVQNEIFNATLESQKVLQSDESKDVHCGDTNTTQLSGYFKISGSKTKNYFFWFFESRGNPSTDPTMIWLTGGPGCSSMLALLFENGPCTVNADGQTLKRNDFSWNENANIMWIDQPAGVGFSYGDVKEYDTNEKMVGEDMYQFLQAFFKAHGKYQKQPFYVFGESYGGHYVPAVAHRIYTGNAEKKQMDLHINLAGIGIGNGLTDPEHQYPLYPEMAFKNTYNVKAISAQVYAAEKAASPVCVKMIQECQTNKAACFVAEMFCNGALVAPYQTSGLNVYDIREKCEKFPMCYDFSNVEKFLQLDSTRKALHVHESAPKWKACNMVVHAGFTYDWMKSFNQLVTPMLENGIRVLVYAGDADFIVNWMGCKAWTLALEWKHRDKFNQLQDVDWTPTGMTKAAGKIRSTDGFTFLQVFEAGHMVPMNQPEVSLKMLEEFISPKGGDEVSHEETTSTTSVEAAVE